jgi:hypothetical protein
MQDLWAVRIAAQQSRQRLSPAVGFILIGLFALICLAAVVLT